MTIKKRLGSRAHPAKAARERRQALRSGSVDRIVRWVGAGRLRDAGRAASADPTATASAGNVVVLTWAQTFGRFERPAPARDVEDQAAFRPIAWRSA